MEYSIWVIVFKSVHLNTSCSGRGVSSSVPPLEVALCKLDDDDIREMEEKCEGGGDVPSKRRECDAIELSFDATLDD